MKLTSIHSSSSRLLAGSQATRLIVAVSAIGLVATGAKLFSSGATDRTETRLGPDTLATPNAPPAPVGSPFAEPLPAGAVVVSLTFDDGIKTQGEFVDMLHDLQLDSIKGTFFINSSRLNLELNERESRDHVEYASLDFWLQTQSEGHEIGSHSVSHLDLSCSQERYAAGLCQNGHLPISAHERRRQICSDGQMLRNLGFNVRGFAYPFGHDRMSADDPTIHDLIARCGFDYARVTKGLRRGFDAPGNEPLAESLPPANPYAIRSYRSLSREVTFEDVRSWIDDVNAQGGGWVPLVLHHISDDCTDPDAPGQELGVCVLRDELEQLVRWLGRVDPDDAAPENVYVKPMGEVMAHFGRPGPVLVANSGMEQEHSGSIARPNCFDRFNGRHESNFEWSNEQLERDRLANGAFGDPTGVKGHFEKLIPTSTHRTPQIRMTTRDDRCYMPVSPQTEYRVQLRARARSSDGAPVTGRFVFRVLHVAAGNGPFDPTWTDWEVPNGPQYLTENWEQYSVELPPLPTDAVGLAFGYQYVSPWQANGNHEIWIDDFSAIEYHVD